VPTPVVIATRCSTSAGVQVCNSEVQVQAPQLPPSSSSFSIRDMRLRSCCYTIVNAACVFCASINRMSSQERAQTLHSCVHCARGRANVSAYLSLCFQLVIRAIDPDIVHAPSAAPAVHAHAFCRCQAMFMTLLDHAPLSSLALQDVGTPATKRRDVFAALHAI
jgi:hypothetical protein